MLAININGEVLKGISASRTRSDVKHAMIPKKKKNKIGNVHITL